MAHKYLVRVFGLLSRISQKLRKLVGVGKRALTTCASISRTAMALALVRVYERANE